jgi:hypothetical protein
VSQELDYAEVAEESVPETQTETIAATRFRKELQTVFANSRIIVARVKGTLLADLLYHAPTNLRVGLVRTTG